MTDKRVTLPWQILSPSALETVSFDARFEMAVH
jgi:hypothetical protein